MKQIENGIVVDYDLLNKVVDYTKLQIVDVDILHKYLFDKFKQYVPSDDIHNWIIYGIRNSIRDQK